jgi:hypothetical protein
MRIIVSGGADLRTVQASRAHLHSWLTQILIILALFAKYLVYFGKFCCTTLPTALHNRVLSLLP